ncbi:ShlB/FhaC/HecB family hemolysin secretion/activation protein [Leptothoe sp. EHU-05/26/07-4]
MDIGDIAHPNPDSSVYSVDTIRHCVVNAILVSPFVLTTTSILRMAAIVGAPTVSEANFQPAISTHQIQVAQIPSVSLPLPADKPAPLPAIPPGVEHLQNPEDLLRSIPESSLSDEIRFSPTTTEEVVLVRHFNILGSTVFDQAELSAFLDKFRDRPLTFNELLEVCDVITQLYVDQGYISSGAFIPADQVVEEGIVTIQVLEGRLAEIKVEGAARLKPNYIKSRIGLATGAPVNISNLLETLQLLQLNPIIETISAELVATPKPGENMLVVQIKEASTFSVNVELNNAESPLLETFQQKIEAVEENLSGYGDSFAITYQHAGNSNVFEADYHLPINPYNGSLDLSYTFTSSEILESPLSLISPESEAHIWSAGISQPILETPKDKVTLGFHLEQRTSRSFIQPPDLLKTPFGFPGSGATEDGLTRLTILKFSQEWQHRTPNQLIFVKSQLNFGTDWLGTTDNPDLTEPSTEFFSWQAQALWLQRFAPNWFLIGRVAGQISDHALVSSELFGLGGANNVRGYRKDTILSDNGVLASLELQTPVMRWPEQDVTISLAPFVDYGFGWNQDNQPLDAQHLASIGAGLIFQIDDKFTARLDYAVPLANDNNSGDTLQESGFLFAVNAHLF